MLKMKNNESGMVLITVLMVVLCMMILSLGIFSQGITQTAMVQDQADNIKTYELAQGRSARIYTDLSYAGITQTGDFTETLDGKAYMINIASQSFGGGQAQYNIDVTLPKNSPQIH